jgi:putative transposase
VSEKRTWVAAGKEKYHLSERQLSKLFNISRSHCRYVYKKQKADEAIKEQLRRLVSCHPRYGFKKVYGQLRLLGYGWNHKRVYRVYCELGLNLRRKAKKRIPCREAKPIVIPQTRNSSWSMDFMSDALSTGRKFRTLNILDDSNREGLGIIASHSLPAIRVIRELEHIGLDRGFPEQIRVDNGPEFIASVFLEWAKRRGITIQHIQPGKPAQNALIERFNRSYREEILDLYLFESIEEVQLLTDDWLIHYNHYRPHDALQQLPPAQFFAFQQHNSRGQNQDEAAVA